jgi:hypothetical protein
MTVLTVLVVIATLFVVTKVITGPPRYPDVVLIGTQHMYREGNETGGVEYVTVTSDDLRGENLWVRDYTPGGRLTFVGANVTYGKYVDDINIDYRRREWSLNRSRVVQLAPWSPTNVYAVDVHKGIFKITGRGKLHGHPVLLASSYDGTQRDRFWLDPSTYLPLRVTSTWGNGYETQRGSYVIDYRSVPRSAFPVDRLPTVPNGFTKVHEIPD